MTTTQPDYNDVERRIAKRKRIEMNRWKTKCFLNKIFIKVKRKKKQKNILLIWNRIFLVFQSEAFMLVIPGIQESILFQFETFI